MPDNVKIIDLEEAKAELKDWEWRDPNGSPWENIVQQISIAAAETVLDQMSADHVDGAWCYLHCDEPGHLCVRVLPFGMGLTLECDINQAVDDHIELGVDEEDKQMVAALRTAADKLEHAIDLEELKQLARRED